MTTFNGFEPANTTPVPDTLFDVLLSKLSGAELKVMLYIIRRTLGFKKTTDTISFTQFEKGIITSEGKVLDEGTGLSRETISKALQTLEEKGCIKSDKGYTPQKDKDTTLYSIRFNGDEGVVGFSDHVGSRKSVPPVVGKTDYGSRIIPEGVVGKSDLQETVLQDTVKQETVLQEREVATATARSQSSSQNDLSEDDEDTVEREAVKPSQKEVVHVQNQSHSGNPGNSSQPHLDTDRNSIPLDASLTSQKDVANGHAHQHPVVDHHLSPGSDQLLPRSERNTNRDTNKVTEPPAPRKPPTNRVPKRPKQQGLMDELPATAHSKPVEPLAEMTWGTRKCLQWFDYWRGGTLIAKYKLQQAASCAKGLAEQFDEATVVRIRGDMADDPYYIERGGPDICDVANNIHKYLNKKKPKKEPSNEHKVVSQYSPKALYEKNKWKADAMIAAYEAQEAAKQGVQS